MLSRVSLLVFVTLVSLPISAVRASPSEESSPPGDALVDASVDETVDDPSPGGDPVVAGEDGEPEGSADGEAPSIGGGLRTGSGETGAEAAAPDLRVSIWSPASGEWFEGRDTVWFEGEVENLGDELATVTVSIFDRVAQTRRLHLFTGEVAAGSSIVIDEALKAWELGACRCLFRFESGGVVLEETAFRILGLSFENTRVTPSKFYPTVRDGFLDAAWFRWTQTSSGSVVIRIESRGGRTERLERLGWRTPRSYSWRWNGRDSSGRMLPANADYRIRIEGVHRGVRTVSGWRQARIATGWRSVRIEKDGIDFASRRSSSLCYVRPGWYANDGVVLDCWGGAFAEVRYGFGKARGEIRNLRGRYTFNEYCCWNGAIYGHISLTRRRAIAVTVGVTYWRMIDIRSVVVRYERRI
jgi:hypothetical protein